MLLWPFRKLLLVAKPLPLLWTNSRDLHFTFKKYPVFNTIYKIKEHYFIQIMSFFYGIILKVKIILL
jgi:hypothetical protein